MIELKLSYTQLETEHDRMIEQCQCDALMLKLREAQFELETKSNEIEGQQKQIVFNEENIA